MKRKAYERLNQRVARIRPTTLVVGIDIAKKRHAAQAVDFRGVVLNHRAHVFANSEKGFECFEAWIRDLQAEHGMDDVVVGLNHHPSPPLAPVGCAHGRSRSIREDRETHHTPTSLEP
ncbi:MAG: transposase [Firmicutes bacterium]|nr:transposase [Bacillota bacterium]